MNVAQSVRANPICNLFRYAVKSYMDVATTVRGLTPYPTFSDPVLHHNLSPIQAPTVRYPFEIMHKKIEVIDGNLKEQNPNNKLVFNNQPNIKGLIPYETIHSKHNNPHPLQSMQEAEKLMEVDMEFHERNEPESEKFTPFYFIDDDER